MRGDNVGAAIQTAVKRAVEEQRRRHEDEVDELSAAMQKSLAALAGERDHALQALVAEKQKKSKLLGDIATLLGLEIPTENFPRISMGLQNIQEEVHGGSTGDYDIEGRNWVLEEVRRCFYAVVSLQDFLTTAGRELAEERFEAMGELDLYPRLVHSNAPLPVCTPAEDPQGLASVRALALRALQTSPAPVGQKVRLLQKLADDLWVGVSSSQPQPKQGGLHIPPSSLEEGLTGEEENGYRSLTPSLPDQEALGTPESGPRAPTPSEGCAGANAGHGQGSDPPAQRGPSEEKGGQCPTSPGEGKQSRGEDSCLPITSTRFSLGMKTCGESLMNTYRSEAALADMRGAVGAALTLAYCSGREHANAMGKCTGGARGDSSSKEVTAAGLQQDHGTMVGGGREGKDSGAGEPKACTDGFSGDSREGEPLKPSPVAGKVGVREEGGGGHDGGLCLSCPARAQALEDLVGRLEALSAEQCQDLMRLEEALQAENRAGGAEMSGELAEPSSTEEGQHALEVLGRGQGSGEGAPSNRACEKGFHDHDMGARARNIQAGSKGCHLGGGVARAEPEGEGGSGSFDCRVKEDREGADGLPGKGGLATAEISRWEEVERLPAPAPPGHGLETPVVAAALDNWVNVTKRRILEGWVTRVMRGQLLEITRDRFVPRVQISGVSAEVRDGLVSHVLPLLLRRDGVMVQAYTRRRLETMYDLQIRVRAASTRKRGELLGRRGEAPSPGGFRDPRVHVSALAMQASGRGYVEEADDEGSGISRQLRDTWENLTSLMHPRPGLEPY